MTRHIQRKHPHEMMREGGEQRLPSIARDAEMRRLMLLGKRAAAEQAPLLEGDTGDGIYQCRFCGHRVANARFLRRHELTRHTLLVNGNKTLLRQRQGTLLARKASKLRVEAPPEEPPPIIPRRLSSVVRTTGAIIMNNQRDNLPPSPEPLPILSGIAVEDNDDTCDEDDYDDAQ